jgi:hypothetical protein
MIETTVDKQYNLAIHKCLNEITGRDILETMQKFYNGSPTVNILWDLSSASMKEVSKETVRAALNIIQINKSNRQPGKTAIVTPSDLEYGMARMFQIMSNADDLPFNVGVFRTLEEARQWMLSEE